MTARMNNQERIDGSRPQEPTVKRPPLATLAAAFGLTILAAAPNAALASDPDAAQSRIVGGKPSVEGAYPWMARLTMSSSDGKNYLCGGSMISPDIILTAQHCSEKIVK